MPCGALPKLQGEAVGAAGSRRCRLMCRLSQIGCRGTCSDVDPLGWTAASKACTLGFCLGSTPACCIAAALYKPMSHLGAGPVRSPNPTLADQWGLQVLQGGARLLGRKTPTGWVRPTQRRVAVLGALTAAAAVVAAGGRAERG